MPYYAKVTLNACKLYPDWIKDKKTKVPTVVIEDDAAAAEVAAMQSITDPAETQADEEEKKQ